MANGNCSSSELPTRAFVHRIRTLWTVLEDVYLALEMRDRVTQDRNPTMTNTVALVVEEMAAALDELEGRYANESTHH